MSKPVCLVTGVGPGTGAALCRRFAAGGHSVAMLARNAERLEELSSEIEAAHGYPCDVSDEEALAEVHGRIVKELGPPSVVVHNAVGGAFGDFVATRAETLRDNFEINVIALLQLAKLTTPAMIEAGQGALLCTGNTSAHRGKANFAGFAPTKAGQRILAQSMARTLGPKGVHVAYVTIDAVIDVPWTRQAFSDQPDEYFIQPDDIAEECFRVAHQPRSAWAFDVELRPFGEVW